MYIKISLCLWVVCMVVLGPAMHMNNQKLEAWACLHACIFKCGRFYVLRVATLRRA